MNTLQLAARVAMAARDPQPGYTPAEAVLGVLSRHRCWFCRVIEREGITVTKRMSVPRRGPSTPTDQPLPFEA